MMGRTHGLSGIAVGLLAGAVLGVPAPDCALLAGTAMFGAYLPDIDHRRSTVTRSVPVLGRVASWVARLASRTAYAVTKGPEDEDHRGEHRHLTHTVVFAVGLGVLAGWLTVLVATAAGVADPDRLGRLIGLGLALGCVTHCVGDALTRSGCPFLWPLPLFGETWYEIRPPRLLRFRTGGRVEQWVVVPALTVACLALLPGVWPYLGAVGATALR